MQVTSLEQLKQIRRTEVIELPSFEYSEEPFIVEVKRPNLMNLISENKIPNPLMSVAMKLFKNGFGGENGVAKDATEDAKALKGMKELMLVIAENTLVNPGFNDLKECDLELTEYQLVELMNYMQYGVKSLESFRRKQERNEGNKSID